MAVAVFYADLRVKPAQHLKVVTQWRPNFTAFMTLIETLGEDSATQVVEDLSKDNPEIIVSWVNAATNDICEIGGVGNLDWTIQDHTLLTVSYENEATTQQQIDESIEWMLKNEGF